MASLVSQAGKSAAEKCPPYLGAIITLIFSKRFLQSVLEIPCFTLDRKHVNLLKVNVICPKNSQKFLFTSINYMTNALLHVLIVRGRVWNGQIAQVKGDSL